MMPLVLSILVALSAAIYLAILSFALHDFSPSALRESLESRGRAGRETWLVTRVEQAMLAMSLWRTVARMAVLVLLLALFVGVGTDTTQTWFALLWGTLLASLIVWMFTSVLAGSIARHLNMRVLSGSLPFVRGVTVLTGPLVRMFGFIDEAVRRLCGVTNTPGEQAEVELLHRIEDTHLQGRLNEEAAEMLGNIVEFSSTDVGEVMTPRTDIEGIQLTDDLEMIRDFIIEAGHSRIPVYGEDMDDIKGILYVKDLIPFLGKDASGFTLQPLLRKTLHVPDTKPVSELLGEFQRSEVHLAIVVDEYGGTQGLVTIEDVLEEIVGEIHDEHDPEDEMPPTLTRIDERNCEVDARFRIDDLNAELRLDVPEDQEFDTVGGYMLAQLGHVPEEGESFETEKVRITAIKATPTHVSKLHIQLLGEMNGNGNGNGKTGQESTSESTPAEDSHQSSQDAPADRAAAQSSTTTS